MTNGVLIKSHCYAPQYFSSPGPIGKRTAPGVRGEIWSTFLIKTLICGSVIGERRSQNAVLKKMVMLFDEGVDLDPRDVEKIYCETAFDSPLRKLVVDVFVTRPYLGAIAVWSNSLQWGVSRSPQAKFNVEFMEDVIRKLVNSRAYSLKSDACCWELDATKYYVD